MAKYRKKPVVIEAHLWNPEGEPRALPEWLGKVFSDNPERYDESRGTFTLKTLEGEMVARPGDWIIKGTKNELYPCKPEIFAEIYEPVVE